MMLGRGWTYPFDKAFRKTNEISASARKRLMNVGMKQKEAIKTKGMVIT